MMKSNFYKVQEEMNSLQYQEDRAYDRADEKADKGNMKAAEHWVREGDKLHREIVGMAHCLRLLGLDVWKDKEGKWNIPEDDIIRAC